MKEKARTAVERLIENVERHRDMRGLENFDASDEKVALVGEREEIMEEILKTSGLSLKKLQTALGINRTTWDRWKKLETAPRQTQLLQLERLIKDPQLTEDGDFADVLGSPLDFLSESPGSYGQIRVLLLHAQYRWREAVFHFREPFRDEATAVDMAALALNGCQIVYMLGSSNFSRKISQPFPERLVHLMVASLGRNTASKALSKFCFVEITDDQDRNLIEFGVLNIWAQEAKDSVGYTWDVDKQNSPASHHLGKDLYRAKNGHDNIFDPLHGEYGPSLFAAFGAIRANTSGEAEQGFDRNTGKRYIDIPRIKSDPNHHETKPEQENERIYI